MSEFSFENENQPVCSSGSSCLTLNVSSILMSSLSSLINAIFIIVCHMDLSRFSRSFSVFGHFVLFNMEAHFRHRIKNKKGHFDFLSHNSDFFSHNCVI